MGIPDNFQMEKKKKGVKDKLSFSGGGGKGGG